MIDTATIQSNLITYLKKTLELIQHYNVAALVKFLSSHCWLYFVKHKTDAFVTVRIIDLDLQG